MRYFITGSGTLATELVKQLHSTADRIVIYSRDEGKHAVLKDTYPEGPPSPMRYRIGDIRDYDRMVMAMRDCDVVIHTAAMKRIETCAEEVYECMKTNIIGSYNVARACAANNIRKAILISTDKSCDAVSAYGKSKAFAEELFVQSNIYSGCWYAACRYGNIRGSRGSVHGLWERKAAVGEPIEITDKSMSRWFWDIQDAAKFVLDRLHGMQRGVIYVPKMPGYWMIDVARGYSTNVRETGLRCGEKLHECMVSETEAMNTYETADYYTIYPFSHAWGNDIHVTGTKVPIGFTLRSCTNLTSDSCLANGGMAP